jgi:hypothetical protein
MSLRFLGDWNPWAGAAAALGLGVLAWLLYRRETRVQAGKLGWVLPLARALVVFLAVLLLTGPVVHHRKVVGERGRVLVFVDASQSMRLTDEPLESARKLLALRRLGWLPAEAVETRLAEAADALGRARRAAGAEALEPSGAREAALAFFREAEVAQEHLAKLRPDAGAVAVERKGALLREVWTGVSGAAVADLTRHPGYPDKPESVSPVELFEAPTNWGENFGTRLRGFLHPPATGSYTFWISANDRAELWLSPDADPARKTLVARVLAGTEPRQWDAAPEQKSQPVRLTAGQKVYVEALHKEGAGRDALAVGWQLPDGTMERPVPGSRLSSPAPGAESPGKAHEAMVARFREEVLNAAQALASSRAVDPGKASLTLSSLVQAAARWEKDLRQAFANYANRVAAAPSPAVQAALQKFDALPRWKRAEALLLGGPKSLLEQLAEKHHVELLSLAGREAPPLWVSDRDASEEGRRLPKALPEPQARTTNLADAIGARVQGRKEERLAVVLLSDGQHNEGGSPFQMAKMAGSQRVPLYPVGLGGGALPEDLAVVRVQSPGSVFYKDRVRGEVVLKDDMPPGRPFTVKIEAEGQPVWEKRLSTEQTHLRTVPFDFPIEALVGKRSAQGEKGIDVLNLPLSFRATATAVDGEKEKRNNDADFTLHAIMQRRRVLILEGRPRWEMRYVRNLFDRDEQWEVNALLADRGTDASAWPRGPGAGRFPADRESLYAYDLLVFGEVPRQFLKMEELEWIRDFVGRRGGGLLVIDGRRGHVSNFADSPMGPLFPVDWKGEAGRPTGLRLTVQGARLAMLALAPEAEKNQELWASLPAPHWVAPAKALPGAEVLLEAVVGERRVPALVTRRFGAGRVLYAGFDESWRWRYEVADLYHQKYWNQGVREIMEAPFAVKDARASLDAGKPAYGTAETAAIRARLRDAQGKPVEKADAEAWVFRGGVKIAAVKLAPDENAGGAYHGAAGPFPPGRYEVRLHVAGAAVDPRVKTEFAVRPSEAGELAALTCNEETLRQIAAHSGGEFFREEEAGELPARLDRVSRERVLESETALGQSYWWFVPLVALLTIEWVIRKWAGML